MNEEPEAASDSIAGEEAPGKLSERLLEAGLRAVYAAGAHRTDLRPPAPEPELPERIGRYDVLEVIGRGGMGVVLRARDAELRRDIAIKLLLDSQRGNPDLKQRFLEEAQVAGQLEHPGIVAVHETGISGDHRPYFTMKLVKGRTLAALLQERAGPEADRVRFLGIFEQVAQTVAYAHSRGVIHRDLKPSNVMVGAFGEVQVMDWGLAKVVGGPSEGAGPAATGPLADEIRTLRTEEDSRSLAGSVMGTPAYMSPEQARGEVEGLDARADVFSLGAILCEVLTGRPPFSGKTTGDILRMARGGEVADALVRLEASGADPEILALSRASLAAERKDRPRDGGAVAEAMKAYRESLEARARSSALEAAEARVKVAGERKARRLTVGLAAAVCVSLVVAAGGYLWIEAERRDRLRAAADTVNTAMGEARQLRGQAGLGAVEDTAVDLVRLEAALAAARRARDRAGAVEAPLGRQAEELSAQLEGELERVRQAQARAAKNLRMVEELEHIRAASMDDSDPGKFDAMYKKTFREFLGIDIESLGPEESAAALRETGVARELAHAIDDWARARRDVRREGGQPWTALVRLAELADPDPRRGRLREAIRNQDAGALQRLKSPAELEAASAADFGLLATGLQRHGDLAGALSVLHLARERCPGDFWILFNLGVVFSYANNDGLYIPPRSEETIRYLTAANALRPNNAYVHEWLSREFSRKGESPAAVEAARKGLRLRPEDPRFLVSLGQALQAAGDTVEATEAFRKAIAIDPLSSVAYNSLGSLLAQRGEPDAALPFLEKSVELNPWDAHHHAHLGWALLMLGRTVKGIEHYKLVVERLPNHANAYENLGGAYLLLDRFKEALGALQAAVRLQPFSSRARTELGRALLGLGRPAEAIAELLQAIRLEPANASPYDQMLRVLEDEKAVLAEKPLEDLIAALGQLISSKEKSHTLAARTFVTAWCRRPQTMDHAGPVKVAEFEVRRTERRDPAALRLLGRVLSIANKNREAVLALEEAAGSPGDPAWVASVLAAARAALLPDLVSYASIDAAVDLLDVSVTLEGARESFAAFRAMAHGDDRSARRHYVEGRLLQRAGMHHQAAAEFREVLSRDRTLPEPYLRLWESLRAQGDPKSARQTFRDDVARIGLPPKTLPVGADRPRNLEPPAGATVDGEVVELRATPFEHLDPRVKRLATRWQIRRPHADYARDPALDVKSSIEGETFRLPPGLLLPSTEYSWRAWHVGSDGRPSEHSEESSFRTAAAPLEAVPFDLSSLFNRDAVADPGDQENDFFEADQGSLLIVEGFDGERDVPGVRGLPRDGIVGVHRLGDPHGLNDLQLAPSDKDPLRLAIPRGRYVCVRFLVAGGNGNSTVPLSFEYAGGARERLELICDGWFQDHPPAGMGGLRPGVLPVLNGMDRLWRGKFLPDREPALFEVLLPASGEKDLEAIHLEPSGATFDTPRTRFHLFAATGIRRR